VAFTTNVWKRLGGRQRGENGRLKKGYHKLRDDSSGGGELRRVKKINKRRGKFAKEKKNPPKEQAEEEKGAERKVYHQRHPSHGKKADSGFLVFLHRGKLLTNGEGGVVDAKGLARKGCF